jgi:outer membrane protein TolC
MPNTTLLAPTAAVFAATLSAQQIPARLTLPQAMALARERNPQYRQALNTRDAAGAEQRAGWSGFLPRITAGMSTGGSSSRVVTGQDDFGEPITLPAPREYRGSSSSQSLSASLTLFDGLGNVEQVKVARASADGAAAAAQLALRALEAETARRFYRALLADRRVELEDRLLQVVRDQLANTEQRYALAAANQEDVLGARADVATQELDLTRSRGEAIKARLALREQMGIEEDVTFEPGGELPRPPDPTTLDPQQIVGRALADHPRIAELEAAARSAAAQASSAAARRWPTVTVSVGLSRSMGLSSYDALFEPNPRNRTFSFGLSLNLPIFTGFETLAQIARADAQARNAEQALRAGRLAVEREVRSLFIDYQNAHRALDVARQTADLSRERLSLARERYQSGQLAFTALQQIMIFAAQAERQLVEAEVNLAVALVTLQEAAGAEALQP